MRRCVPVEVIFVRRILCPFDRRLPQRYFRSYFRLVHSMCNPSCYLKDEVLFGLVLLPSDVCVGSARRATENTMNSLSHSLSWAFEVGCIAASSCTPLSTLVKNHGSIARSDDVLTSTCTRTAYGCNALTLRPRSNRCPS